MHYLPDCVLDLFFFSFHAQVRCPSINVQEKKGGEKRAPKRKERAPSLSATRNWHLREELGIETLLLI